MNFLDAKKKEGSATLMCVCVYISGGPVEFLDERVEGLAGADGVDAQLGRQDLQTLVHALVPHAQEVQLDQSEREDRSDILVTASVSDPDPPKNLNPDPDSSYFLTLPEKN